MGPQRTGILIFVLLVYQGRPIEATGFLKLDKSDHFWPFYGQKTALNATVYNLPDKKDWHLNVCALHLPNNANWGSWTAKMHKFDHSLPFYNQKTGVACLIVTILVVLVINLKHWATRKVKYGTQIVIEQTAATTTTYFIPLVFENLILLMLQGVPCPFVRLWGSTLHGKTYLL